MRFWSLLLFCVISCLAQGANVVTADWSIAATLTEMGHPPLAMGDKDSYKLWVRVPQQPDRVINMGSRYYPNRELLAQLPMDKVFSNPFYSHLRNVFPASAPLSEIVFDGGNTKSEQSWSTYVTAMRQLGDEINDRVSADRYIQRVEQELIRYGDEIRQAHPNVESYATVLFGDAHQLRIYARNSMFHVALQLMGLKQADFGVGDRWGNQSISLKDLAKLPKKTCLLILGPFSKMAEVELSQSYTWARLGFGKTRCVRRLPAVWLFGGPDSILHFSRSLHQAMTTPSPDMLYGEP